MKIALIGFGKMGKAIEPIALERGHEIVLRAASSEEVAFDVLLDADVAIEFTNPESAVENIVTCIDTKTPVVVGTTGWYDHLPSVLRAIDAKNGAILPATNFSLGVNIFLEINERLAQLMNHQNQYEMMVEEIHHTEKLDAPSGTAITIAEGILENTDRKSNWVNEKSADTNQLEIISYREPNVPGTHEVTYASDIDQIQIKHTAHSRKGFALGAVIAAEFLYGKTGVYSMKDVLKLN